MLFLALRQFETEYLGIGMHMWDRPVADVWTVALGIQEPVNFYKHNSPNLFT